MGAEKQLRPARRIGVLEAGVAQFQQRLARGGGIARGLSATQSASASNRRESEFWTGVEAIWSTTNTSSASGIARAGRSRPGDA